MILLRIILLCPLLANVAITQTNLGQNDSLWISKSGKMNEHLLGIQAFIIKEEGINSCTVKKKLSASDKRYLMCVGSIVNHLYVLTSAYCIHEAITIRHNIKGSLAVMIAPFTNSTQIIKIINYRMHPQNTLDVREETFSNYNVALVKLSCRILERNLFVIELPQQRLEDLCMDESCLIGVISKNSAKSFSMYEARAKNVVNQIRKRDAKNMRNTDDGDGINLRKSNENARFNRNNDRVKLLKSTRKGRSSNTTSRGNYSKFIRSITAKNLDTSRNKYLDNSMAEYGFRNKKISIRSSDGTKGCAMTGTAVMSDNTQAGLVALACDDRQPDGQWIYTGIVDVVDWIKDVLTDKSVGQNREHCSTCIYNFFFPNNCSSEHCLSNMIKTSGMNSDVLCQHINNLNASNYNQLMNKSSEYTMESYKEAIKIMYGRSDQEKRKMPPKYEVHARNVDVQAPVKITNAMDNFKQRMYVIDSLETSSNLTYSTINNINTASTNIDNNELHNKYNHHQEHIIDSNDDDQDIGYLKNNNYYIMTENKESDGSDYYKNNQYAESSVPEKYLILYKMFLEEQQKLGNKNFQY